MPLRLVMMATGEFALPTFQELLRSSHVVPALVTQPDRTGKGHHRHENPLKQAALEAGVEVFQPENANAAESLDRLREFGADLFVVAAYGQLLSADLLQIPPRGAINLHASLLPRYRGAAPIQYALWKGETETGVTIFQIEPRLDAGPVLGVVRTPIGARETSGELHDRLAQLSAPLTLQVLADMEQGTLRQTHQNPEGVTRAPRLKKEQGQIDWSRSGREVDWHVRAMQPWPMPFTFLHLPGRPVQRLLVLSVDPAPEAPPEVSGPPGSLHTPDGRRLFVKSGDGPVEILNLQPAGKRAMSADEFQRGTSIAGGRLGSESLETA